MSSVVFLAADDKSQSHWSPHPGWNLECTRTDRRKTWEFECGNILDQRPSLCVSFFDAAPMATANADFDPFYLRHVSFYLIKYYISHLLTDTSKNERNLLKACSNIDDFTALDIPASTATSSSNSSIPMAVCVTPTTRTTAMTVLFVKRVCKCFALAEYVADAAVDEVWVGPLVVKELKRIVESSEITK